MDQFIKDYSDYIVALPVTVITVLVSLYIYRQQRNSKKLGYETIINSNLFEVKNDIKENISITYKGTKAENLKLIAIKIINIGKLPILISDFESNIKIAFDINAKIIDLEILEKHPNNLDVRIDILQNNILILPCLINAGEFVIIKTILDSLENKFDLLSRIAGITSIIQIKSKDDKVYQQKRASLFLFLFSMPILFMMVYYGIMAKMGYNDNSNSIIFSFILSFVIVMMPLMYLFFFISFNKNK